MESDLKVGDKIALFTTARFLLRDLCPGESNLRKGRLVIAEITGLERVERAGTKRSWSSRYRESRGETVPLVEYSLKVTVKGSIRKNGEPAELAITLHPGRWAKI